MKDEDDLVNYSGVVGLWGDNPEHGNLWTCSSIKIQPCQ